MFVQYLTLGFVKLSGRASDADGWRWTILLYGGLAILPLLLCFLTTREQVIPRRQQKASIKHDRRDLLGSRAWLVLIPLQVLTLSAFTMRGAASAYYFKYFVKRQELLGLFLVWNGLAFLAAVSVASRVARLIGKKQLMIINLWLGGLLIGLFTLAGPSDLRLIFALQLISSFVIGFKSPLVFAMFADAADHVEWHAGRRIAGLIFASVIFSMKIGMAMGALLLDSSLLITDTSPTWSRPPVLSAESYFQ